MFAEIVIARFKAHLKHGVNSLESGIRQYHYGFDDNSIGDIIENIVPEWDNKQNRILVEEIGEISKAMNKFALGNLSWTDYEDELASEIVDSIAVLSAWHDKLTGKKLQDRVHDLEKEFKKSINEIANV